MTAYRYCRVQVHILATLAAFLHLHLRANALQGNTEEIVAAAVSSHISTSSEHELLVIPIRKQYVPVKRNDTIIAYRTAYFGTITLGSPLRQEFKVVFDTGSGHLIVPGSACETEICMKKQRFKHSLSDTVEDIEFDGTLVPPDATERDQATIAFGTGKVHGEFVRDQACLGLGELCVETHAVLAVEMSENPFTLFGFDGVIGLGLPGLSLHPEFSFLGQLMSQMPEATPVFSVFLARSSDQESVVTFGGFDEKRFASTEVAWVPLADTDAGYWQVHISSIRIGDTVLDGCMNGTCRAILDTGTSQVGVPKPLLSQMQQRLLIDAPNQDIDCRTLPGLPIEFDLGNVTILMDPEDYRRPAPLSASQVQGNATTRAWSTNPQAEFVCKALLLGVDMGPPLARKTFLWGEPLLRKYFTVYDPKNQRAGFAKAKPQPARQDGGSYIAGEAPTSFRVAGSPLPTSSQPHLAASTVEKITI